jgi:Trypsin-co-occurring domain 1
MANIVRFADGVLVEITRNPTPAEPVAGKAVERANQAFQAAAEVLATALKAIVSPVQRAVRDSGAKEAELEFGVAFTVEGNIYVTKVTGEGNITIKVTINGDQEPAKA